MTTPSLIIQPKAYQSGSLLGYRPSLSDDTKFIPMEVNFTRTTTKTRVNSFGLFETVSENVPMVDYYFDGTKRGLLIEPQSTNGILRSFDLDGYIINGVTRIGNIITETNTNSTHYLATPFYSGFTTNTLHCFSVIVKKISGSANRWISIDVSDGTSGNVKSRNLNLQTGEMSDIIRIGGNWSSSGLNDGVIDLKNGYWLIWLVAQSSSGSYNAINLGLKSDGMSAGTNQTYIGDDSVSIYAIGFQREVRVSPTSRINTNIGSAVTRVVDYPSIGVSRLFDNNRNGTLYWEFFVTSPIVSGNENIGQLTNGNDFVRFRISGSTPQNEWYINSTFINQSTSTSPITLGQNKIIFSFSESGSIKIFLNGVNTRTASIGTLFTPTTFQLSQGGFKNPILDFRLYNSQLSDSECIQLTTL